MSLRIVIICALCLMMLSIANADSNLQAILSLQKGSEVSSQDLKLLLKTRSVIKVQQPKNQNSELGKFWVLELRDDKSFDALDTRIRRMGLPLSLDWNDLRAIER